MSEIIEGIICRAQGGAMPSALMAVMESHPLLRMPKWESRPLEPGMELVLVANARADGQFANGLRATAEALSARFGQSLQIAYDSRTGTREADLWVNGKHSRHFGSDDELWVPLDDRGEPATGPVYHLNDLQCGEEYETSRNAIQLGLDAMGVQVPWSKLMGLAAVL